MIILIILTSLTIVTALYFSMWKFLEQGYSLMTSSLSVIAAGISGLMAIIVLKDKKDSERPFITIKSNYDRYGVIQISVKNNGSELATIQGYKTNNHIILI